jgi:hypothetical protein
MDIFELEMARPSGIQKKWLKKVDFSQKSCIFAA